MATKLGVTNKAVSKWETGKSLPDISLYKDLCKYLDITLNELFAGESLSEKTEKIKTEETIINIVKDNIAKKKKIYKLIKWFLVITIILTSGIIFLYNYVRSYMTVAKTFELNWQLILPSNFKEEYYIDSEASFHGDGQRYSIFSGNSFLTDFKDTKDEIMEEELNKFYEDFAVPEDRKINFDSEYQIIKINRSIDERDYLYIIYEKNTGKFYFFENFF